MLEHLDQTSYYEYAGLFLLFFAGQLFFLRKKIWNVFDPLILTLIYVSFNVAIIFFLFLNGSVRNSVAIYILFGIVFFILGLKTKRIRLQPVLTKTDKAFGLSPKLTIVFIVISLAFQLIAIGFIFRQIGFGILMGTINPDLVKVTLTQDGMGIFRHIGVAGDILFVPLVAHAYFSYKMKRLTYACIIFYALKYFAFPFSKSGLVFLVFDLGILMHFYKIKFNYIILTTRKVLLVALVGSVPALVVLTNISSTYEKTIITMLMERFIVTGYGTYQYFVNDGMSFFEDLSFFERLNYYLDTLLSMLKIKDWEDMSYMAQMEHQLTGLYMPGFGANPYLFLDGHFLFGWAGIFYCYAVGFLMAFGRSLSNNVLLFFIAVKLTTHFVADPAVAQAQFVSLFFYLPVLIFLYLYARSTGVKLNFNLMNFTLEKKAAFEKI